MFSIGLLSFLLRRCPTSALRSRLQMRHPSASFQQLHFSYKTRRKLTGMLITEMLNINVEMLFFILLPASCHSLVWRGGDAVARWIRNRTVPFQVRIPYLAQTWVTHYHCVIPVCREFTHGCSRSTQPSHPSVGIEKWGVLCAASTSDTFCRLTIEGTCSVSWCHVEGCRNGREISPQSKWAARSLIGSLLMSFLR